MPQITPPPMTLFDRPATPEASGAVLSDDGLYRFRLWRRWGDGPAMTWIMLNPSIADALRDDQTIRRCISFATREGCDAIEVVNLFAWRATQPADLLTAPDPIGPGNARCVESAIENADGPIVAAWGYWWITQSRRVHGPGFPRIAPETYAQRHHRTLHCLGYTKAGAPRHPCRLHPDTPLEVFQ